MARGSERDDERSSENGAPDWFKLQLDRAAQGYENFDARKDGWTKVILKPGY